MWIHIYIYIYIYIYICLFRLLDGNLYMSILLFVSLVLFTCPLIINMYVYVFRKQA